MNSMARRRGFSMMELMFVVAIIGVLLAVGLPKLGGSSQRAALETTGRDIARLSAYARQTAISSGQPSTITFNRETNEWWLKRAWNEEDRDVKRKLRKARRGEHAALSEEEEPRKLHQRLSFGEFLIDGEEVKEDTITVTFYPNGNSSGLAVVLENSKGKKLSIEIEPSTGRAVAYAGEPKDFAQKLEEVGIDPTKYGLTPSGSTAMKTENGGNSFYQIGSEEERVNYYSDAAERIMQNARNRNKYGGGKPASGDTPAKPSVGGI